MEILLVILAFILLTAGLLGAVVPVLPGPPLSYIGLLALQLSGRASFSAAFLWIWAGIAVIVTVMDYFLPAIMTKKFGGSRAASIGSLLGLLIGIFFFPPWGIIIGPFLGAFAGELIFGYFKRVKNANGTKALKVAFGAFLAFLVGTGFKLIASSIMVFHAIKAIL